MMHVLTIGNKRIMFKPPSGLDYRPKRGMIGKGWDTTLENPLPLVTSDIRTSENEITRLNKNLEDIKEEEEGINNDVQEFETEIEELRKENKYPKIIKKYEEQIEDKKKKISVIKEQKNEILTKKEGAENAKKQLEKIKDKIIEEKPLKLERFRKEAKEGLVKLLKPSYEKKIKHVVKKFVEKKLPPVKEKIYKSAKIITSLIRRKPAKTELEKLKKERLDDFIANYGTEGKKIRERGIYEMIQSTPIYDIRLERLNNINIEFRKFIHEKLRTFGTTRKEVPTTEKTLDIFSSLIERKIDEKIEDLKKEIIKGEQKNVKLNEKYKGEKTRLKHSSEYVDVEEKKAELKELKQYAEPLKEELRTLITLRKEAKGKLDELEERLEKHYSEILPPITKQKAGEDIYYKELSRSIRSGSTPELDDTIKWTDTRKMLLEAWGRFSASDSSAKPLFDSLPYEGSGMLNELIEATRHNEIIKPEWLTPEAIQEMVDYEREEGNEKYAGNNAFEDAFKNKELVREFMMQYKPCGMTEDQIQRCKLKIIETGTDYPKYGYKKTKYFPVDILVDAKVDGQVFKFCIELKYYDNSTLWTGLNIGALGTTNEADVVNMTQMLIIQETLYNDYKIKSIAGLKEVERKIQRLLRFGEEDLTEMELNSLTDLRSKKAHYDFILLNPQNTLSSFNRDVYGVYVPMKVSKVGYRFPNPETMTPEEMGINDIEFYRRLKRHQGSPRMFLTEDGKIEITYNPKTEKVNKANKWLQGREILFCLSFEDAIIGCDYSKLVREKKVDNMNVFKNLRITKGVYEKSSDSMAIPLEYFSLFGQRRPKTGSFKVKTQYMTREIAEEVVRGTRK